MAEELVLVNKTGFPLFEVFFASQDSSDWGDDILPFDVIMPDNFVSLEVDEPFDKGLYKIQLLDEDGEIYVKHNIDLSARKKILIQSKDLLVLSSEEGLSFTLVNHTADTVTGLYISLETEESWGKNLIDGYFLNESELNVKLPQGMDAAFYDIRFDLRENSYIQKHVFLSYRARILLSLQ